ncbi:MAG: DNA repair protein RadC [Bacteroidia bacterium]|nr:DNA repair protein RadC [Bacteroidia bacterium]
MNKPIPEWADDEKPREKLILKGKSSLSNSELLGILISTGTKTKSAIDLGRELLELAQNDLNQLARFNVNEIVKIKGFGTAKAITIIAAIELGSRRKHYEAIKKKVNSSKQAYEILEPIISDNKYEEFWVLLLNRANYLISCRQISEGGISGTVVDLRKIFKIAIEENACSLILAHNHPSGNIQPSDADKNITKKIKESGLIVDIPIVDHLIVANNNYYSFADEGIL